MKESKQYSNRIFEQIKDFRLRFSILVILILFSYYSIVAQSANDNKPIKRRFALYMGIGPNYYFNNLVVGKNQVNEFNYTFVTRIMWEPEHLLSVGLETGYIRLYTLKSSAPANARINNSAIPIHLVISMRFLRNWYFNWSMGQSALLNRVHSDTYGDLHATSWSLADFGATLGYKYKFNSRFSLGIETKFFYSTGNMDRNIALVFLAGYKF
jgi:hypothetical protein